MVYSPQLWVKVVDMYFYFPEKLLIIACVYSN